MCVCTSHFYFFTICDVSLFYNYIKIKKIYKSNIFKITRKLDTACSLKLSNKQQNVTTDQKIIFSLIGLKDALNLLKYEAKCPIPEKNLFHGIPSSSPNASNDPKRHFIISNAFFSKYDISKRHAA